MAPRSRIKPAGRDKSGKQLTKLDETTQATTEDFQRADMGIAPKE